MKKITFFAILFVLCSNLRAQEYSFIMNGEEIIYSCQKDVAEVFATYFATLKGN